MMKIEADPTRAEEFKALEVFIVEMNKKIIFYQEKRKAEQIIAKFAGTLKKQDTFKSNTESRIEPGASRKESIFEQKSKEKMSINADEQSAPYQKKNSLPKNHRPSKNSISINDSPR